MSLESFFQSKLLALTALIMFICCLACISSSFMPLWLNLDVDVHFGDDQNSYQRQVHFGIFFLDENRFINMLMQDKSGRNMVVPPLISVAQIFYLIGVLGMVVCTATAFVLGFRRFASTPGEMCLAGATTPIALSLLFGVVFVVLSVFVMPNEPWRWLPVPDIVPDRYKYNSIPEAYPKLSLSYGFFVACFAALLGIASTALMWIQACKTCSNTREKRYQMLRQDYDAEPAPKPGNPDYPVFSNIGYTRTTPGEVDL